MKKKAIVISVAVIAALAAILIPIFCIPRPVTGKIAVIPLSGTITAERGSFLSGSAITPDLVKEYLTRAERDPAVKAIVLRIDSPGGEIAPCQEILWEIEKAKETKHIVVSMAGMAASGGYYISAKADKIIALPTTMTGSIGVISAAVNIGKLLEELGIQIEIFKDGRYKDMYQGFRELTPEEEEIMQRMVDEYYEQFLDVVAEGRGLDKEEVRSLATGQIYTGTEAKELGLIDELGGLDTAIESAIELAGLETATVKYYEPPRVTLRSLLGLADVLKMRLSGLSAQDIVLLEILSHSYRQPLFLYQG